jgi:hypothetical protein
MEPAERKEFLAGTAAHRTERLNTLVDSHAVPWTEYYSYDQADEGWYRRY